MKNYLLITAFAIAVGNLLVVRGCKLHYLGAMTLLFISVLIIGLNFLLVG